MYKPEKKSMGGHGTLIAEHLPVVKSSMRSKGYCGPAFLPDGAGGKVGC